MDLFLKAYQLLEQTSKLADLLQRANNAKKQETRERNMEKFYVELVSTFGILQAN